MCCSCIIALLFLCLYTMFAFSYTLEAFINRETVRNHWYIALFVIILSAFICLMYVPGDLGEKLYRTLNKNK